MEEKFCCVYSRITAVLFILIGSKKKKKKKKKKITHEPITRIISKQLDIKLGPFTQEELDSVLRKIKNRKAAGLDEIPPEVWKTRQFDDILQRSIQSKSDR